MSIKDARAANWVAERADPQPTSFRLLGASRGYATFSRAFSAPQEVFYSAHDDMGNRECGYGTFDGSDIVARQPTATLVNGIYSVSSPPRVSFTREITVACTFNASAFNTLWKALEALDPDGDGNINIPPELIDGLGDALRNKADQAALEEEIQARKAGDEHLQQQIDDLVDAGLNQGPVKWVDIEEKPEPIESLGVQNLISGGTF
jgi:hypothetical protein